MLKRNFNEDQNNLVVGFKGLKRSGKTLAMTLFLYLEYLKGKKILTNYWVSFPHEIIDVQKLVELHEDIEDSAIGIDEIHMICDSRRSSKKQNILMSYFVLQSGHRDVNLYYTSQFNKQFDVRIRDNTDIDVVCRNLYVDSDEDGLNDLFHLIFRDRRTIPIHIYAKVLYGKPVFDMYNTKKIVDIFTMKEIQQMKVKKVA